MTKTILLTGSEGYIGSFVKRDLQKLNNIHLDCVDLQLGTDIDSVRNTNYDVLIHLASHTSVSEGEIMPAEYYNNNCSKFKNLMDNNKFGKVIYSSSASIYDIDGNLAPDTVYGNTKLIAEFIARSHSNHVAMRFANPVGVDLDVHSRTAINNSMESYPNVFWALAKARVNKSIFNIHNIDGMVRDFFPLSWISDFIIKSINSESAESAGQIVGDICSTKHVKVIPLLVSLCEDYGIDYEIVDAPQGTSFGYSNKFKSNCIIDSQLIEEFDPISYCKNQLSLYIKALEEAV